MEQANNQNIEPMQISNSEEEKEKKSFFDVVKLILRTIKNAVKTFFDEVIRHPFYILTHPVAGWQAFKQEKKGKMWVGIVIILLYVAMKMVEYNGLGPVVNTNNPQKFNSITILVYSIVPPILLSVANWSVTTLMDGKGKMKEIIMMAFYSYCPVMLIGFLKIFISNYITTDEAQFILLLNIIGWGLTGILAFTGLMSIHEYGLGRVLWCIILTAVAAVIMCFIALLLFNLAQQVYGFFYSIYDELSIRYM